MSARLKILFFAGVLLMSFICRPVDSKAGALLLFDAHTGEVLYEDLAGSLWHPASLTKMMTLYIALKSLKDKKVDPLERVLISKNATREPPSKIGLRAGVKIPLHEALEGMFIRSANDLAVAVAEHFGGTKKNFVKIMNATAQDLGMTSSSFANPHGLPDDRQITTARDMGILGRALLREFPEAEKLYTAHFAKVRGRKYRSRNLGLLKGFRGANGIKTGFICASGYNLVGSATRQGRQLIAVMLGGTSGNLRNNRVMDLLARGFNHKLRGDMSHPKRVSDIKNQNLNLAQPIDMTKTVCRQKGIEVIRPYQLKNWSVIVSNHESIRLARKHLRSEMIGLREAVFAGRGVVMRGVAGRLSSVVTDLSEEDAVETCLQINHKIKGCKVIKPGTYKKPPPPVKKPKPKVKKKVEKKVEKKDEKKLEKKKENSAREEKKAPAPKTTAPKTTAPKATAPKATAPKATQSKPTPSVKKPEHNPNPKP